MSKPALTVERLTQGGFQEIGCWELDSLGNLSHAINLPRQAGVYAFAIDEIVQYVGLASTSLHQRLNFYRKPGASQRTNIRLNGVITERIGRGANVRIFVAHPPEHEWNGFRIKGAEGLEAGLIAAFELPWNMRGTGSVSKASNDQPSPLVAREPRGAAGRLLAVVKRRPGMTELEIARALHGPTAVQQQVNQECRRLVKLGSVTRRGRGGVADPFTYYPAR